ncbi:MAG: hypothetical protein RL748_2893, partial [Pseudomonadota bacterium]
GLYRILIETDQRLGVYPAIIVPEVNRRLHRCRSLGEDFLPPVILATQNIMVQAKIEIGPVEDPERLLAEIYLRLANTISPDIHFYTLQEMLDQGKSIDQIFDGPALEHGFIDDDELMQFQRKTGLRTSDLLQKVMQVSGVLSIDEISIRLDSDSASSSSSSSSGQAEDWYLKLPPDSTAFLDIDKSLFAPGGPGIGLTKGGIGMQLDPVCVKAIITRLQQSTAERPLPQSARDIAPAAGQDRQAGQYTSFQYQFPELYGIGAHGLPDSSSPQRRAQSQQLKAYLMFFDQLLANYFAQLGNAKQLFSFDRPAPGAYQSYFSQSILDPELGLDEILSAGNANYASMVQDLTESAQSSSAAERKNRFLNHLLARFGEQFTDYSILQYAHLGDDDLIDDKSAFLQDYQTIGQARGSGFNLTLPGWDSDNISGLEKRISLKLGISGYHKHDLAQLEGSAEGGFHALEHILLRPRLTDLDQSAQISGISWQTAFMAQSESKDPYSHQISFVFPDWIARFTRPGFPELIEKTLREETPAHLHISLVWLDRDGMQAFEVALKTWLDTSLHGGFAAPVAGGSDGAESAVTQLLLRDARDCMVRMLGIGIPYPLRDIPLQYDSVVAYNHPGSIRLQGAQMGVSYQLCDEDGNAIVDNGKTFKVALPAATSGSTSSATSSTSSTSSSVSAAQTLVLSTPAIVKDITYTIMATRSSEQTPAQAPLECYLNQVINILTGIDTTLAVSFNLSATQTMRAAKLVCNYGDIVTVIVSNSQEGISYKLVDKVEGGVNLSAPVKGNKGDIKLVSTIQLLEDSVIYVQAYRTSNYRLNAILDATVGILVRPNPALAISVDSTILKYQTAAKLTIALPQASAEYRLYRHDLALTDYLPDGNANGLIISTPQKRNISVQKPGTISNWANPPGFVAQSLFVANDDGSLSVSTGNLAEDALFIVQVSKLDNHEQLQLAQAVAILVQPNQALAVSVAQATVAAGSSGMVQLTGTQKGVSYQLRVDSVNTLVNPPGYHQTDRGIDTTRIGIDLVVADQGQAMLLLPTDNISQSTKYNVLARKTITGVTAQLSAKATIGITTP